MSSRSRLIVWLLASAGLSQAASQANAQPAPVVAAPAAETPAPPPAPAAEPSSDAASVPAPEAVAEQAAPVEAPAEEIELSAAELAAMGLSADATTSEASAVDTSLKLSGFADIGMMTGAIPKSNHYNGPLNRHTSFYVGNLNVYLSKNLTESVRMFGEVRFMLLPNGAPDPASQTGRLIDTNAADYTDFGRSIQWGGINIERLYLEWTAHRALVFRGGQYLTPYGIWNVDHGTPTIVTVQKPFIIGQQLFPERQTGIEVLGQFDASAHNGFGYHLTLSNGTGPATAYKDFDGNKGVGGRVYWRYDGFGDLRIGGSAYYGRNTAATEVAGIGADGKHVVYTQHISSSADILSLAADLQWKLGGLLVQSEVVTQQRKFLESARIGAFNPLLGQYLAPTDKLTVGVYGLVGYRFDWYGVMPYFLLQNLDTTDPTTSSRIVNNGFSVGLNVRPIDALVFKVEYNEGHFPKGSLISDSPIRLVQIQIAWAF